MPSSSPLRSNDLLPNIFREHEVELTLPPAFTLFFTDEVIRIQIRVEFTFTRETGISRLRVEFAIIGNTYTRFETFWTFLYYGTPTEIPTPDEPLDHNSDTSDSDLPALPTAPSQRLEAALDAL